MNKRRLGRSAIEVSPLAFGANVFGWTLDEPASFRVLDALLDSGINFIDTADYYSAWVPGNKGGESETILGNWLALRGARDRLVIATKVGKEMPPEGTGLSADYIPRAVENSLRRLRTDYVDLYQSHEDDPTVPLEETLAAYAKLIEQGKVRAIGASNYSADRLSRALAISEQRGLPRYETLQPKYNLYDRSDYESELEPLCLQHSVSVLSHSSLGNGFLTGKYRSEKDLRSNGRAPRVKEQLNARGFAILKALDEVAQQCNSTPAAVALAWLIARPGVTVPIASATSPAQLAELLQAATLELRPAEIEQLDRASAWSTQFPHEARV